MTKEIQWFKDHPSFERTYGWSWFLYLYHELKKVVLCLGKILHTHEYYNPTKFGQDWTENKKKNSSVCKILVGSLLKFHEYQILKLGKH